MHALISRLNLCRLFGRKLRLTLIMVPFASLLLAIAIGAYVSVQQSEQWSLERLAILAALGAASDKGRLQDAARPIEAAMLQASANGYDPDNGDILIINIPPTSGPYAGFPDVIEVIAKRPASSEPLSYLVARAVATVDATGGPCLLPLNKGLIPTVGDIMRNDSC